MKDLFLSKLNNEQYISNFLYQNICLNHKDVIPFDFNIDEYNNKILHHQYLKYYDYFKTMYDGIDVNIQLDEEQIKAVLADEDYSLIIAGAGTGKTTTMASKVKYLVDIKKVDPSRIAVMSYTKKATEELEKRIVIDFGIPARVVTFHSLGFMHIREIFKNRKCFVVDDNLRYEIFFEYFKERIFPYRNKVEEILELFEDLKKSKHFIFGKYFVENFYKYGTFEEYFEEYKKYKLSQVGDLKQYVEERIEKRLNKEIPLSINNEIMKSKGEALIANFLYRNNIEYKYEKVYKEVMSERRVYRPDFTLELGGQEIYIEYFGLSNYDDDQMGRYEKIKKIKENYHKERHTKFIKLDYMHGEDLIKTLEQELIRFGFELKPKSYQEIFYDMMDHNPTSQLYPYVNFLYDIIDSIKSSIKRSDYVTIINNYINSHSLNLQGQMKRQFYYIHDFYQYYQRKLYGSELYGFDYGDLIYYANLYIDKIGTNNYLNFDYLIIDEYQDISQDRYEFAKKIVDRNHAKVVAVGDDWQSIYAFAGSKIEYIYNFQRYFPGAKLLKITQTYRNSQDLIDYSGDFIMKNKNQITKTLISNKKLVDPIQFVMFDDDEEYIKLKELILHIHKSNTDHKILVLARKNAMIRKCFEDPELRDEIGTKIEYVGYEDIDIDGMTIHKSKGLTCDEVILIGLNQFFPSGNFIPFWMQGLFRSGLVSEQIPFAEERRLFYVGLTRTKNRVYLLVNRDPRKRSPFLNELYGIIHKDEIYSSNVE